MYDKLVYHMWKYLCICICRNQALTVTHNRILDEILRIKKSLLVKRIICSSWYYIVQYDIFQAWIYLLSPFFSCIGVWFHSIACYINVMIHYSWMHWILSFCMSLLVFYFHHPTFHLFVSSFVCLVCGDNIRWNTKRL